MSYEKITIKETIKKIGGNDIYLPAIQRKFVWKKYQIEKLFDSLMRGYPIGTFLFWFIEKPYIDEYVFYKFLQNYHQRDKFLNEKAPNPELKDNIIGVLDGQQRLSSMYIALQGTYSVKKPYYGWKNDKAFPELMLYINLLSSLSKDEDDEFNYSFKFISKKEAEIIDDKHLWLNVRTVINWDEDPPIDKFYRELKNKPENEKIKEVLNDDDTTDDIKKIIRILHKRLVTDEVINYFKINEQKLDNILKIFVRVNSGGTILSKTDLLFSTIIANWEDGRDEIEAFITKINKKGNKFYFNNDFVMRSCLVLTDCPIVFKVNSFKTENVIKIKREWSNIANAVEKTIDLLTEYGLNGDSLSSQNSIIPIAYYFIKGGLLNSTIKEDIRLYVFHSLLKNIFGGQGDAVLSNLRNALRQKTDNNKYVLKNKNFLFSELIDTKLPANKTFKIKDEDLDEFMEYKKGNSAFLILSLLYSHLKFEQISFHQDHIHPASNFTENRLKKAGILDEKIAVFQNLRDKLPNLQLMEGKENESKNKTPFKEWLDKKNDNGNLESFLQLNFIPTNVSLEFSEFESIRPPLSILQT